MRPDDFWGPAEPDTAWGLPAQDKLRMDLLNEIRAGPVTDGNDLDVAGALVILVWDEFLAYGTAGNNRLRDPGSRTAMSALMAILKRLGIDFSPPFSDMPSFRTYWIRVGASGSGGWGARRRILHDLFDRVRAEIERRQDVVLTGELADPITERPTGWPEVDAEIEELRRHFRNARTEPDYRNIGNDCVTILERVSAAAYDPGRHLRAGEEEPPSARTKQRIGRVLEDGLPDSAELRSLATAVLNLAQATKHNPTSDRLRAGIAADATIQLTNMVRRVAGPG